MRKKMERNKAYCMKIERKGGREAVARAVGIKR